MNEEFPDVPESWSVEPYSEDDEAPEGIPSRDCTGQELDDKRK